MLAVILKKTRCKIVKYFYNEDISKKNENARRI